jgi:uncharacterized protein YjbI with pentapeptide repeats
MSRPKIAKKVGITLCVLTGFFLFVYLLWRIPEWYFADWAFDLKSSELLKAQNDLRTTMAQAVGGAALIIGLFFTWKSVRATERGLAITQENAAENLKITQRNLEITQENIRASQENAAKNLAIAQEGQITERFTRAVEQLGDKASMSIRLGGVYSLERIAKDSERDHGAVIELITAYVREHARCERLDEPLILDVKEASQKIPLPAADIQAIMTVISRRTLEYEKNEDQSIDLSRTDLRRGLLKGANLQRVNLSYSRLDWALLNDASFEKAHLTSTYFTKAFLNGAIFDGANLIDARFTEARLRKASFSNAWLLNVNFEGAQLALTNFEGADLEGSNFQGAKLYGVNFNDADLTTANIRGVNLSRVKGLTQEQVDSAFTDEYTKLPKGIQHPSQD